MKKTQDHELNWRPVHSRQYAICTVQIFESETSDRDTQHPIILITEETNLPGQTVASGAELVARIILLQHGFRYTNTQMFVHYPASESWSRLTFANYDAATTTVQLANWQPVTWKHIAQKLNMADKSWNEL